MDEFTLNWLASHPTTKTAFLWAPLLTFILSLVASRRRSWTTQIFSTFFLVLAVLQISFFLPLQWDLIGEGPLKNPSLSESNRVYYLSEQASRRTTSIILTVVFFALGSVPYWGPFLNTSFRNRGK